MHVSVFSKQESQILLQSMQEKIGSSLLIDLSWFGLHYEKTTLNVVIVIKVMNIFL
jgi:hypothetical protein